VTLGGEAFTNWSVTGLGEITTRKTTGNHPFLARCLLTEKARTKASDLREATTLMENDELIAGTAGTAGTGDVRQVLRQVSRFVLG
jgi:hypothetical protein